ncbi:MAG: hypothetical protein AAGA68_20610 [Pseudomonadota bacterium]
MEITSGFEDLPKSPLGWDPAALVVTVANFSLECLEATAQYLTDAVDLVVEAHAATPTRAFPIRVRSGGGELSERMFWRLLGESSRQAAGLVSRYIARVSKVELTIYSWDDAVLGV